jgi:transposase
VPSLMQRRRVLADRIMYVGLDVHKKSIVVAVADGGLRGEVRDYGRIANTAAALDRLTGKLGGAGVRLRLCYEAGPCGYGIQRHLSARGHDCVVVAPSLIPKRAGDRVKTDRRDAAGLARLHRAGELTAVWVPERGHEAMRDLVRARLDAVHALRRARQQLSGFLCCATAAITAGRPGPSCIGVGWRGSNSSRQYFTWCSRTMSKRLKPPRPGAIG